jgi:ABC-type lipoprotein export system ATPase subunit
MSEWNAIDLHMHTVSGITGDGSSDIVDNFSYVHFLKVLTDYNLKLVAITNHNFIDILNFTLCRYLASLIKCNVLFGVEIDSDRFDNQNFHFVALFDENLKNCLDIRDYVNELATNKKATRKVRFSSDEIVKFFDYNVIIVPHGNKDKGLLKHPNEKQIIDALKKVREGFIRVFDSPSDWKLSQIKEFIKSRKIIENLDDFGGVLFSDIRDWKKYDEKCREFYMNAEPTFRGFLHSITNPTQRFSMKKHIRTNTNYIYKIVFKPKNENNRIEEGEIYFQSGFNCIIGRSGSGKSLLLHAIKKSLSSQTLSKQLSKPREKNNYSFLEDTDIIIYNEKNNILNSSNVNIGIGETIFDKIITASNSQSQTNMYEVIKILNRNFEEKKKINAFKEKYKSKLTKYTSLFKDIELLSRGLIAEITSFNSSVSELNRLKDTEILDLEVPNELKQEYSEEDITSFSNYKEKSDDLRKILQLFKSPAKEKLLTVLDNLYKEFNLEYQNVLIKKSEINLFNKKISIINKCLERISANISSNSERKQQLISGMIPKIRGILDKLKKFHLSIIKIENFDLSISIDEINNEEVIDEKNGVSIKEYINEDNIKKLNLKTNDVFYTWGKQAQLDSAIYDMTKKVEAKKVIDLYYQLGIMEADDINRFFQNTVVYVDVFFDGQNVKQLNPGTITKKYIEMYFKNELANGTNSIILYDQIENDVDKTFIKESIVSLIKEMKSKAQLIVVTHDPIIAVNADPVNYIEAKKERNIFSYRSFVPESIIKNELETIAENVDGSIGVIKERYEIYKGEKSYENNNL